MSLLKLKNIVAAILLLVALGSCIKNDDDYRPQYGSWGFYDNLYGGHYVVTDDDITLKIENFEDTEEGLKSGDRVYFAYYVVSEGSEMAGYDFLVELTGDILPVDRSDIQVVNEESRDTLGTGQVALSYLLVTGDYLNMDIKYYLSETDNVFSLCYNEENQTVGEVIELELRSYNNEDDVTSEIGSRLQSFNLMALLHLEGYEREDIEFDLVINKDTSSEDIYRIIYSPTVGN
ncbi:hypothetical protein E9993_12915 [Labilibacter sediminis]|nr:hypothetical protein E9993_12915 [Labilibacter sediminis]